MYLEQIKGEKGTEESSFSYIMANGKSSINYFATLTKLRCLVILDDCWEAKTPLTHIIPRTQSTIDTNNLIIQYTIPFKVKKSKGSYHVVLTSNYPDKIDTYTQEQADIFSNKKEVYNEKNEPKNPVFENFSTSKETEHNQLTKFTESYWLGTSGISRYIKNLLDTKQIDKNSVETLSLTIFISCNFTLLVVGVEVILYLWVSNRIISIENELANRLHSRLTWKHEYHISISTYYDN